MRDRARSRVYSAHTLVTAVWRGRCSSAVPFDLGSPQAMKPPQKFVLRSKSEIGELDRNQALIRHDFHMQNPSVLQRHLRSRQRQVAFPGSKRTAIPCNCSCPRYRQRKGALWGQQRPPPPHGMRANGSRWVCAPANVCPPRQEHFTPVCRTYADNRLYRFSIPADVATRHTGRPHTLIHSCGARVGTQGLLTLPWVRRPMPKRLSSGTIRQKKSARASHVIRVSQQTKNSVAQKTIEGIGENHGLRAVRISLVVMNVIAGSATKPYIRWGVNIAWWTKSSELRPHGG